MSQHSDNDRKRDNGNKEQINEVIKGAKDLKVEIDFYNAQQALKICRNDVQKAIEKVTDKNFKKFEKNTNGRPQDNKGKKVTLIFKKEQPKVVKEAAPLENAEVDPFADDEEVISKPQVHKKVEKKTEQVKKTEQAKKVEHVKQAEKVEEVVQQVQQPQQFQQPQYNFTPEMQMQQMQYMNMMQQPLQQGMPMYMPINMPCPPGYVMIVPMQMAQQPMQK
ncbi:hypothetical protein SS50377_28637 [Spironucleus salmonicida]|uniref:Uncharacterized protein n=1 Tax=Spironucleus salmonicida TaxID=348837 RepID=V6LAQ4_9EUKA|nr:hypothetical protein SS50377_28637 [Spironucleus salmonicida]|eukprot:EST41540.1 Hypothetical protein SS50377_18877 [Spironucleus salmonicida]